MSETLTATARRLAQALARSEQGGAEDMGAWYALVDELGADFFARIVAAEEERARLAEAHGMELARLRDEARREVEAIRAQAKQEVARLVAEITSARNGLIRAEQVAEAAIQKAKELRVVLEMVITHTPPGGRPIVEQLPAALRQVANGSAQELTRTATPGLINALARTLGEWRISAALTNPAAAPQWPPPA